MGERDERFAAYRQARLRVWSGRGGATELRPFETGTGLFPFDGPVHVLTAYNPGPTRLDDAENARRQSELVAGLASDVQRWDAEAGSIDGSHVEASVVVRGLT